jgi:ribosomal-protein-alanine N-acetyltransferase
VADGCTGLTLEVRVSNDAAQAMYRRFGYAPAGIRKNYYSDEGEDGLIMWAHDVHLRAHGERLAAIDRRLAAAPAPSDS